MRPLLSLAAIFGCDAFRAAVLMLLWGWFIVPLGVPEVGVVHAFGIILVRGAIFGLSTNEDKKLSGQVAESLSASIVLLVLGWLTHLVSS